MQRLSAVSTAWARLHLAAPVGVDSDHPHGGRIGDGDEHQPGGLVLARARAGDTGDPHAQVCLESLTRA